MVGRQGQPVNKYEEQTQDILLIFMLRAADRKLDWPLLYYCNRVCVQKKSRSFHLNTIISTQHATTTDYIVRVLRRPSVRQPYSFTVVKPYLSADFVRPNLNTCHVMVSFIAASVAESAKTSNV